MVLTTAIPTSEQIVGRSAEILPALRERTAWAEDNRRLHDDTITTLASAGVFKLRTPIRYGGYEASTRTLVDVATQLGRADGASSWVASVYWIPTWMACQFPDPVQDEIFATPDARVCGTLSPTAMAAPADGGIVVNGKWGFVSGALHAHWQEIVAVLIGADGQPMPIVGMVPMSDLQIVDDWYTTGLAGSGSVSTVAENVFVPQERFLPLPAILQGQGASVANSESAIYRAPLLPVASASSVGTAIGLATGAFEAFMERLPDRKITYTEYGQQSEAPLTHHQVATARLKIDQAQFHAYRLADLVDSKAAEGAQWTLLERTQSRADMGAGLRLAKEAVDILASASGGSSIYRDVAIQRIHRDITAMNLHALMHPDTNDELYGRVLCGQEPNTLYL